MVCPCVVVLFLNCLVMLLPFLLVISEERRTCTGYPVDLAFISAFQFVLLLNGQGFAF